MERHLNNIGINCVEDLKGKDPEELYRLDSIKKGYRDDPCVLYVYRCAVYFAEHEQHEAEKLKWWYWKDKEYPYSPPGLRLPAAAPVPPGCNCVGVRVA